MELSIVIPIYKSKNILSELIRRIERALFQTPIKEYEIILINDCSPDDSWQVIEQLCNQYSFIKGINLRKNAGQHNAIMAGLNHANGQIIVMMDDDLQHSPDYIYPFYLKVNEGYDVCYTKYIKRKHTKWKIMGSILNNWTAEIFLGKPKGLYLSSFKAITADIKNEVIKYTGPFTYIDGLILVITSNITTIEVEHHKRYDKGIGNYNFRLLVRLWVQMATNFSIIPLRLASLIGLLFSIFGFLFAIWLIIGKIIFNTTPVGWSSLIVTSLVLGGVQLLTIGIIGEYIGRIYLNLNKKPQFVIKSKKNFL